MSIYAVETAYLEETPYGNIVRGFESFVGRSEKKSRPRALDHERIFSKSSFTYTKSLEAARYQSELDLEEQRLRKLKKRSESFGVDNSARKRKKYDDY